MKGFRLSNFGFVSIGSHTGKWLEKEIEKSSEKKIILIEPVNYNLMELKERVKHRKNVIIEEITIGDKDGEVPFYFVKKNSLDKLKKHWASGIGSFNKNHILSHKTKRFDIKEEDIEEINVKCLSFNSFVKKHSITSIDKLMMDIEGSEYNILKSINYDEIFIKNIVFEKKHFDGPFKEGVKLNEIKLLLSQKNYKLIDLDEENIQAVKK